MAWQLPFSLVFVAIAFGGFARTYLIPTATGTFDGPTLLHVHGILFLGWTVMLAVQTELERALDSRRIAAPTES